MIFDEYFLGKGDHFGEQAIMRNNWRVDYTAVATTFCIL